MKMVGIIFAVLILSMVCTAYSAVKPASLFTDNAVLQRGMNVPVWGTAGDGERVTVEIQGQKASAVAKDGKWMVRLKPLKEGGPYTMTISGSNRIELRNILVGEVWVASGQSNMAMQLIATQDAEQVIKASGDPMLRLYSVPPVPSRTPAAFIDASWVECGPETSPGFSAVAYYFARDLRKALGCPVGVINTSYGGTRVEAWTMRNLIEKYLSPSESRNSGKKAEVNCNEPAVLYDGMIYPLIPYAIKGAIWYQGESNAGNAWQYRSLFPIMINNWRANWGQGDFPFLFVQLAPYTKIVDQPQESQWAELREAQLLTTKTVPNTAMAVITDCGNPDDIHPKLKQPVGERLALAARAMAYGERATYMGPEYKSMSVKGNWAILEFDNTVAGLVAKGGDLTGFTIAGEDRIFYNAQATIQGNRVVVSSPNVTKPIAVRYGWAYCPVVNLYNGVDLPASPFRTDDFPLTTQPKM